jgi:hypothetical protein
VFSTSAVPHLSGTRRLSDETDELPRSRNTVGQRLNFAPLQQLITAMLKSIDVLVDLPK